MIAGVVAMGMLPLAAPGSARAQGGREGSAPSSAQTPPAGPVERVALPSPLPAMDGVRASARSAAPRTVSATGIALEGAIGPIGLAAGRATDPTLWFAAPRRSAVGEVDLETGAVGYISLGHGAKPRDVTFCPNGHLYVLDPALNVIHEVEPQTELSYRIAMPVSYPLDLQAAICTPQGQVIFTGYSGSIGVLDTASRSVRLMNAVTGRGASAIAQGRAGAIWFASYASNQIVRLNPLTSRQDRFALPRGVRGPKALSLDAQGRVWVSAYRSGHLTRFDPRRRSWDSWSAGEGARPYGLEAHDTLGVVFADAGHHQVRSLDPATGTFRQLAALPAQGQPRDLIGFEQAILVADTGADQLVRLDIDPVVTQ